MMKLYRIVITLALLLLPLAQPSAEGAHSPCVLSTTAAASTNDILASSTNDNNGDEATLSSSCPPLLSTTTTSGAHYSTTPIVRTLHRCMRIAEREAQHAKDAGSIDSTTATSRYGLYNHKILFVSHSRHYYLCRLVRLII